MNQVQDIDLRIAQSPQTLRELAVNRLRQAIIAGAFKGGDRLVERTLCDQMGVSRSVIREAVRYLEAEGLVENQARGGPIVSTMDWPRAKQIYDIRLLLESDAAAECAKKANADVKAALTANLRGLNESFSSGEQSAQFEASTRFYETIFRAAGKDIAWEIVNRLNSRISRLRALTLHSTGRLVTGPAHMEKILQAICENDSEKAAQAVRAHLTDAAEIARRILEENNK